MEAIDWNTAGFGFSGFNGVDDFPLLNTNLPTISQSTLDTQFDNFPLLNTNLPTNPLDTPFVFEENIVHQDFNADACASTGPHLSVFPMLFPVLPLSILTRFFLDTTIYNDFIDRGVYPSTIRALPISKSIHRTFCWWSSTTRPWDGLVLNWMR
jgi:hypothetical protein